MKLTVYQEQLIWVDKSGNDLKPPVFVIDSGNIQGYQNVLYNLKADFPDSGLVEEQDLRHDQPVFSKRYADYPRYKHM